MAALASLGSPAVGKGGSGNDVDEPTETDRGSGSSSLPHPLQLMSN